MTKTTQWFVLKWCLANDYLFRRWKSNYPFLKKAIPFRFIGLSCGIAISMWSEGKFQVYLLRLQERRIHAGQANGTVSTRPDGTIKKTPNFTHLEYRLIALSWLLVSYDLEGDRKAQWLNAYQAQERVDEKEIAREVQNINYQFKTNSTAPNQKRSPPPQLPCHPIQPSHTLKQREDLETWKKAYANKYPPSDSRAV